MGVFEKEPFAAGTLGVARAVSDCGGFSVIGGGDTIAAVQQAGVTSASATSPPRAARFSSFSRAACCRAWPRSTTPDRHADPVRGRQLEDARHHRGSARPRRGDPGRAQAAARRRGGGLPSLHGAARGERGPRRLARSCSAPRTATGRTRARSPARSRRRCWSTWAAASSSSATPSGGTSSARRTRRSTAGGGGAAARSPAAALRRRDGRGAPAGADVHGGRRAAPRGVGGAEPGGDRPVLPRLRARLGDRHRRQRDAGPGR